MLKMFKSICLAAVASVTSVSASFAGDKPNLIVILTDDQGYADVGFNGSTEIKTPHIDRIAYEGARFTSGYVTYPVCGPSRAGFLTGRYQDRFGFVRNPTIDPTNPKAGIPHSEKNIAEVLSPAGYTSALIGKWHMGTHPDMHPNKRGFDHFYGFLSGGHRYFPHELTLNDLSEVTKKWEWYNTRLLRNNKRVDTTKYLTDELSDEAVRFIEKEKDNPFFLYVAYNAPHAPLQASEKYLKRYSHIKDKRRRTYAAMVSAVDDGVGQILASLKKNGLDDNTIIFFLSDNGGALKKNASDNGILREGKGSPHEGGVRVPFAMRWPAKVPAGVDYHNPVSSMDVLGTIVGEANVDMSKNNPIDGVNLVPFVTKTKSGQPHEMLFWRWYDKKWFAARRGDAKIILKRGQKMMFDLASDITESNDISAEKAKEFDEHNREIKKWNSELKGPAFPKLGSWKFSKGNEDTKGKKKKGKKNKGKKKNK